MKKSKSTESLNVEDNLFDTNDTRSAVLTVLHHPWVSAANSVMAEKMASSYDKSAADLLEDYRHRFSNKLFVEFLAELRGVSPESILGRFVQHNTPPPVILDNISIPTRCQPFISTAPIIVAEKTDYGVMTVVSPVPFLELTEAADKIARDWRLLRLHFALTTPESFYLAYERLFRNISALRSHPPESDELAIESYCRYLGDYGLAPSVKPASLEVLRSFIAEAHDLSTDGVTVRDAVVDKIPLITPTRPSNPDKLGPLRTTAQRHYKMTPISFVGNICTFAASSRPSQKLKGEIRTATNVKCAYMLAHYDIIARNITAWEAHGLSPEDMAGRIDTMPGSGPAEQSTESIVVRELASRSVDEDVSVVELVQTLLLYGLQNNATDIHISQQPGSMRVRYRIDGLLSSHPNRFPSDLSRQVLARIKVLAGIDTSFSPVPQDGKFPLVLEDKAYDVRVNTTPTVLGSEEAVLRVLPRSTKIPSLKSLGFQYREESIIRAVIDSDHGMLIICGPTGSGKSTTLASIISMVDLDSYKVISGEQPVEIRIPGVEQTNITATDSEPDGLSFEKFIESGLRRDPDYIIIGETRDKNTATQAVRAALTGHIVMTTLHTNSAGGAPNRLIDLGVQPFLLKDALSAVCAQRLLPRLCPNCASPGDMPDEDYIRKAGLSLDDLGKEPVFMRANGCPACRMTGYSGRICVVEAYFIGPEFRKVIGEGKADETTIRSLMFNQGGRTLFQQGVLLAAKGVTDLRSTSALYTNDG